MDCSLSIHNRGYQTSWCDGALDIATGFTGAHYAMRHWELSGMAHKTICAIECVPILGGIVALIERIAFVLFRKSFADVPWREQPLPSQHAQGEMEDNLLKANKKHAGFARVSDIDLSPVNLKETFAFTHDAAAKKGVRPTMEDAHFYKELGDKGILAGVFDGHGGRNVADYACQQVEKRFPDALKAANGNVQHAFELLIHQIHREVVENASWNSQGSTAVICYIDKETNMAYTATIGDTEVHLYRKVGYPFWKSTKAIALSLVEDWTSVKAFKRLKEFYGMNSKAIKSWVLSDRRNREIPYEKALRSRILGGVNVSNAIGDVNETGTVDKPLVTHRPNITALHLNRGDQIVLACDGLWDYAKGEHGTESEIAAIVMENQGTNNNLAQKLVDHAISEKQSTDNVSVLTIGIA